MPAQYHIFTYPADFTLEVLRQKWLNKEIGIPDFQRAFVWKLVQSSRLLESFLVGLPIPLVYVFAEQPKEGTDSRKRDMELLVRFFAMRDRSGYQKPMKDFLSKFMQKNKDVSIEAPEGSASIFHQTCVRLLEALGEKPFHVRSGLNAAVMDAVMVAFSENLGQVPVDVKERYQKLLADEGFRSSTNRGTTGVSEIEQRFSKANQVSFG